MLIEQITLTPFQQHTRLLVCEETRRAVCVDPGEETGEIVAALERLGLELQAIALTHAHMDHVGGVAALKRERPRAEIILHAADEPLYFGLPEQPAWLGIPRAAWPGLGFVYEAPPPIERHWEDGETYRVGRLEFRVLHCPGHTPGHVVLFEPNERKVFVGDCLFAGSVGRTDLPGGDHATLLASISTLLERLPDDTQVLPGHMGTTTLGRERASNPFLHELSH